MQIELPPPGHDPVSALLPLIRFQAGTSFDTAFAGCRLYMNWEDEVFFMELEPFHSRKAMSAYLLCAEVLGLEAMDYMECDVDTLPCGTVRIWLAEVRLPEMPFWPWSYGVPN